MTVSQSPAAGSSLQTTRQMLDELDALMERMLALPVNELEDAPPSRTTSKPPTVAASLTLLSPASTAPAPAAVPRAAPAAIAAALPAPAPLPPLPPTPMPAAPEPIVAQVLPPSQTPQVEALLAEVPAPVPSAEARLALPLLWLNEAFDRATESFGFAGRLGRGPSGRMILGLTGLALLIASVIWLLKDSLGWPC